MKSLIYFLSVLKYLVFAQVGGSLDGYFTYSEIVSQMQNLTSTFPSLAQSGSIGKTYKGEDIHYLQLSTTSGLSQNQKTGIIITAAQFAGYPQGPSQVMFTAQELSNSYGTNPNVTFILSVSNIWLVPVINVDAYKIMENSYSESKNFSINLKNLNTSGCQTTGGVNLDRNWGYKWDDSKTSEDPCNQIYQGSKPFSEPETSSLKSFIEDKNITLWIHYDRDGNVYVFPYTYSDLAGFSVSEEPFYDTVRYQFLYQGECKKIKELYGSNEYGTLIDYALSKEIFSLEVGINMHNNSQYFFNYYYNDLIDIISLSNFYLGNPYYYVYEVSCDDYYYPCTQNNSNSSISIRFSIENEGIKDATDLKLMILISNPAIYGYTLLPTSLEIYNGWQYSYIPISVSQNSSQISVEAFIEILAFSSIDLYLTVEKTFTEDADSEVEVFYEWLIFNDIIKAYDSNDMNMNISKKISEDDYWDESDDDNPHKVLAAFISGLAIEALIIIILIVVICCYRRKLKESTRFNPNKNFASLNGHAEFKPVGTPSESIDNSPQRYEQPRI